MRFLAFNSLCWVHVIEVERWYKTYKLSIPFVGFPINFHSTIINIFIVLSIPFVGFVRLIDPEIARAMIDFPFPLLGSAYHHEEHVDG